MLPRPSLHPNYRPDIDGLRAVAVLSVVGFHAFPQFIRGGFIGVDIFFVISGYLISTILFENLQHDRFSLVQFYSRRIRRIFPALLLVLISVLVFGWFALFANEYQQLGKHVAGGAAFISNYLFWGESGYFDTEAITKPLLHLWSLGIEEQFYIVWPVILWLGWRLKANLLVMTLCFALVSFGLNFYGIRHDVVATFYSPQTRFWELLSGSLLAWLMVFRPAARDRAVARVDGWLARIVGHQKAGRSENLLSFTGLLLVAGGIAVFHHGLSFPGMRALIPVLGAVLIIAAGAESWLNRTILSSRILVWFGLISYPLYLWHWPILSLATTIEGENLSPVIVAAALLLAVVLAWLTFRWLERPIRYNFFSGYIACYLIALLSVTGIVGYMINSEILKVAGSSEKQKFLDHFENSFPKWQYFSKINLNKEWRSECAFIDTEKLQKNGFLEGGIINSKPIKQLDSNCYKRNKSFEKSVLVWGDSHAQALSPGLVLLMPKNW
ncbi:MAG: acyltransferase family protein, partial [Alphaproteobacteria bacterium]|nr:acyltransferase family protein [Alphaproteobacteria bacterium]